MRTAFFVFAAFLLLFAAGCTRTAHGDSGHQTIGIQKGIGF